MSDLWNSEEEGAILIGIIQGGDCSRGPGNRHIDTVCIGSTSTAEAEIQQIIQSYSQTNTSVLSVKHQE